MYSILIIIVGNKQIKHGLEGNMQVYGLVGQTEEGIWPEAQLDMFDCLFVISI